MAVKIALACSVVHMIFLTVEVITYSKDVPKNLRLCNFRQKSWVPEKLQELKPSPISTIT